MSEARGAAAPGPGYEACSGCGICALACPLWHETRDVWFTPHGRARALQGGARAADVADSALSCWMCGACEPVCPEKIDILGMVRGLRRDLHQAGMNPLTRQRAVAELPHVADGKEYQRLLLPGPVLSADTALLDGVVLALGGPERVGVVRDDGRDLSWALETGAPLDDERVQRFMWRLGHSATVVAVEGILHTFLRRRRSGGRVAGLAEVLLEDASVRRRLGARDLLVLEPRGYHADHSRLVRLYDQLREETGCALNLDLQRVALATGSDLGDGRADVGLAVDWLLAGRDIQRIVVEAPGDLAAIAACTEVPVTHLAALAEGAS